MRTTIRLDDRLLAQAKRRAAATGKTLTAVFEEALRESFARRKGQAKAAPVRLKTVGAGGLHAGVNIDDSAALLDLMNA